MLELEKTTQEAVNTLKPFFKKAVHHEALKEHEHSSMKSFIKDYSPTEHAKNKEEISKEEIKKLITAGSFKPEEYNLRGMDFSGLDLSNISFDQCDLSGANFNGAKLRYTDFNFCKFSTPNGDKIEKASFENADISTSQFTYCDLREIDFEKSKIEPESSTQRIFLNFSGCNLQKASFKSQKFYDTTIKACDLREADFSGVDFIKTNLSLSNLEEAKLKNISARRTNFWRSNLKNTHISFKESPEMPYCDLRASNWQYANYKSQEPIKFTKANLSGEDLTFFKHEPKLWEKFDFTRANLEAANLSGLEIPASKLYKLGDHSLGETILRRANLAGAKFIGDEPGDTPKISKLNFSGANLSKVNFNQAHFHGRIDMRGANLNNAKLRGIFSGDGTNCLDIRLADLRGVNLEKAYIRRWVSAGELHDKGLNLRKHGEVLDFPVIMGNYDGFDLRGRTFDKSLSVLASFLGADLRGSEFEAGISFGDDINFCFANLCETKFPDKDGKFYGSDQIPCYGAAYDKDKNGKKKLPSIFKTSTFSRRSFNLYLNRLKRETTLAGYNLADRSFVFHFDDSGFLSESFKLDDYINLKESKPVSRDEYKKALEDYKKALEEIGVTAKPFKTYDAINHKGIKEYGDVSKAEYEQALRAYQRALELVHIERVDFDNLDIRNANFSNANLEGCSFEQALASGARFDCANLSNCNLDNADLADANFNYADMRNSRANGPFVNSDGVRLQATNQPPRRLMFNSIHSHNAHYAGGSL